MPERDRLQQQYQKISNRLIHLLEELRDYIPALEYAQRLLQVDPLDEDIYLCLMRLHALNNNRAKALRVYHDCVTTLQRELEVEPGAKVRAAYERLIRLDTQMMIQTTRSSLFSDSTPLIGRQPEWVQLSATWQYAMDGHPLFALITGEAGIGKTRLAEELLGWAGQQGIATARSRAYEAEGRLPYASIAEWLRSSRISPALARLEKVWPWRACSQFAPLITN
jgi:hypothetical protein